VYFEKTYGKERLTPEMSAERERVLRFYQRSPGSVIDTTTASLMRLLNPNSYQKGAWVLHMLRQELGEEVFWKGIRLYYETFRNRNAMTDDFRKVMEKASGKDLNLFFNQWLYVAGQPELKITRSGSGKDGTTTVVIEQVQQHVFRFPLDLLIKSREGSLRETLQISERITKTTVRTSGPVEVIPDPDVRLLFREVKE
jgi:aminopeptidase N